MVNQLNTSKVSNEQGQPGGSGKHVEKEQVFRPALDYLDKHDMVGVAHWCNKGGNLPL